MAPLPQLPAAGLGAPDGLWLDVYAANALSRVGGLGECAQADPVWLFRQRG